MNSGTPIVFVTRNTNVTLLDSFLSSLIAPAYASSSSIKFCFRRLRLQHNLEGSEYDLKIGERLIDPYRTPLGNIVVPPGTYERIEFDLEMDCTGNAMKPSVSFTNDYGTFSTDSRIKIRFDGNFVVKKGKELELNITPLIEALNSVTSNSVIRTKLESAVGTD